MSEPSVTSISCPMCLKENCSRDDFLYHLKRHLGYKKYACGGCSLSFYSEGGRDSHCRTKKHLHSFEVRVNQYNEMLLNQIVKDSEHLAVYDVDFVIMQRAKANLEFEHAIESSSGKAKSSVRLSRNEDKSPFGNNTERSLSSNRQTSFDLVDLPISSDTVTTPKNTLGNDKLTPSSASLTPSGSSRSLYQQLQEMEALRSEVSHLKCGLCKTMIPARYVERQHHVSTEHMTVDSSSPGFIELLEARMQKAFPGSLNSILQCQLNGCGKPYNSKQGRRSHVLRIHFKHELRCPIKHCTFGSIDPARVHQHAKDDHSLPDGFKSLANSALRFKHECDKREHSTKLDALVKQAFPYPLPGSARTENAVIPIDTSGTIDKMIDNLRDSVYTSKSPLPPRPHRRRDSSSTSLSSSSEESDNEKEPEEDPKNEQQVEISAEPSLEEEKKKEKERKKKEKEEIERKEERRREAEEEAERERKEEKRRKKEEKRRKEEKEREEEKQREEERAEKQREEERLAEERRKEKKREKKRLAEEERAEKERREEMQREEERAEKQRKEEKQRREEMQREEERTAEEERKREKERRKREKEERRQREREEAEKEAEKQTAKIHVKKEPQEPECIMFSSDSEDELAILKEMSKIKVLENSLKKVKEEPGRVPSRSSEQIDVKPLPVELASCSSISSSHTGSRLADNQATDDSDEELKDIKLVDGALKVRVKREPDAATPLPSARKRPLLTAPTIEPSTSQVCPAKRVPSSEVDDAPDSAPSLTEALRTVWPNLNDAIVPDFETLTRLVAKCSAQESMDDETSPAKHLKYAALYLLFLRRRDEKVLRGELGLDGVPSSFLEERRRKFKVYLARLEAKGQTELTWRNLTRCGCWINEILRSWKAAQRRTGSGGPSVQEFEEIGKEVFTRKALRGLLNKLENEGSLASAENPNHRQLRKQDVTRLLRNKDKVLELQNDRICEMPFGLKCVRRLCTKFMIENRETRPENCALSASQESILYEKIMKAERTIARKEKKGKALLKVSENSRVITKRRKNEKRNADS